MRIEGVAFAPGEMDPFGKKSVRFSSQSIDEGGMASSKNVTVVAQSSKKKAKSPGCSSSASATATLASVIMEPKPKLISNNSDNESNASGDSWDAFDAKMLNTKVAATKEVKDQFLELSITQNKSLNLDKDDFESMPFMDAKELIEKDENERLQFMNSNLSFDKFETLDQVEAPSLLSFTSYFQQGSSFPVPYEGNDSTMMFGGKYPPGMTTSFLDPLLASETLRRFSNVSQQHSSGDSFFNKRASTGSIPARPTPTIQIDSTIGSITRDKADVARNDSLTSFFLGKETHGMDKTMMMEHVLDYCKRRASFRQSETYSLTPPRDEDDSVVEETESTVRHIFQPGLGRGGEKETERTVIDMKAKTEKEAKSQKNRSKSKDVEGSSIMPKDASDATTITNSNQNLEGSIVISDGASLKDFNISDVGGMEGFEKFTKNLNVYARHGREKEDRDRYRDRNKQHLEFEQKRLQIDERYSHPQLSPSAFSRAGATESMERPRKRVICNSPPEKLVTVKKDEQFGDENANANAPSSSTDTDTPRNPEGQYHSTPVTADSFIRKIAATGHKRSMERMERINSSTKSSETKAEVGEEGKQQKRADISDVGDVKKSDSDSAGSERSSVKDRPPSGAHLRRKKSSLPVPEKGLHTHSTQIVEQSVSTSSTGPSNSNVLKPNNLALTLPPQVLPVVTSAVQQYQQQQQQFGGGHQCSCPHQCGQQQQPMTTHGVPIMGQSMPIVIHIHLPCPTTAVPTPTTELPPKLN